ncbi:hypothetical protein ACHAXR_012635 [Thalassiosira sp. AJA248-18]
MTMTLRCNAIVAAVALLLVAITPSHVASFQIHRPNPLTGISTKKTLRPFTSLNSENPREEEVIGEQYEGSVDWDSEWKKVVENKDQPSQRPGKYKSQAEISAIKTTNKVAKNVFDATNEMKESLPKAPSIRSLQGDWRFWIGIIVIVSFGLSLLTASSPPPGNESFYI